MPYQSTGGRRNNVQMGVGRSLWGGTAPAPIPERVLDGLPGCLAWLALFFCIASAIAFPTTLQFLAAVLGLYSAARFAYAGISNFEGLRRVRQWEQIDWYTHYVENADEQALPWEVVKHIVIIPNYKEPFSVLRRTLDSLAQQYQARQRLIIVMAMEAAEEGCVEKAEILKSEYEPCFAGFYFTVHPRGLPGEMQSKSPNQAWAVRWIKRKLIDELGYDLDHLLVTTMDADTRWHPNHFYALTSLFALNPNRHKTFWQGIIRYHGNVWSISPPMRLLNAYASALELAYLTIGWWKPMPMSSYALSLRLLDTSGYWDGDVIADEWHMFIKAYFASDGEVQLERMYLPFWANATTGENVRDTIKSRYQQSLRHAWGSKEVGYMIAKTLEHPEIPIRPSLRILMRIAHDILLAGAGWIIITVGGTLPTLLHPEIVPSSLGELLSNPTYLMLQISFLMVAIVGVVFWYQDVRVRPPRIHPLTLQERLLTIVSFPLLAVMTLFLVAIPVMEAQTRLLAGIPLQFRVTKKV